MSLRKVSHVRPPNQSFNEIQPHPSTSSNAYSDDMRSLCVENRLNGTDGTEGIKNLQQLNLYPSRSTVDRWMVRYNTVGHARSFRRTGNHRARRELRGRNLILLSLYRTFLPTASIAEYIAYLYQMNIMPIGMILIIIFIHLLRLLEPRRGSVSLVFVAAHQHGRQLSQDSSNGNTTTGINHIHTEWLVFQPKTSLILTRQVFTLKT